MPYQYAKFATRRLARAAKAQRVRAGVHLSALGLHPGQEVVLKALAARDGLTMSELASELCVQPPTVTKMVTRLAAHGFLVRQTSQSDGRLARVFLTEPGRAMIADIDRMWKRLEKEALAGLDDKDRKRLRKYLRKIEKNLLTANGTPLEPETGDDEDSELEDATA